MSDYFARAAARADPVPDARRATAAVAGPLEEPAAGIEELEEPTQPSTGEGPVVARSEPVVPPAPGPWAVRPVVEPLVRDVAVEPAAPAPTLTPPPATDDRDSRDRATAEPRPPAVTTFEPRPVEVREPARPVATEAERLVPVPLEQADVAGRHATSEEEALVATAAPPPAASAGDDPLAVADAFMWGPLEPPLAVLPPPEARATEVSATEATPGPTVVIDRLTVELVDDRPAAVADPAPRPRPRPTGRLAAGSRFDSGWGW